MQKTIRPDTYHRPHQRHMRDLWPHLYKNGRVRLSRHRLDGHFASSSPQLRNLVDPPHSHPNQEGSGENGADPTVG